MLTDLRYAVRQLIKNPTFSSIAVLSLTLGIGATTAVFSIIDGALLRPLPYDHPEQLAFITLEKAAGGTTNANPSGRQVSEWASQGRTFGSLATYSWAFDFLVLGDRNQSLEGMLCSPDLFDVLGLRPQIGRTFTSLETSVGEHPVVVIGNRLWRSRFGGDPSIIGKTLKISRQPSLTVIGVMPPGVRFLPSRGNEQEPNYDLHAEVDYWLPAAPDLTKGNGDSWNVVGRLKPGVTIKQARAEMANFVAIQAQTTPDLTGLTAVVTPVEKVLSADIKRVLLPLFGAVSFVLLVAAANVAGLLLVRGLGRQRELAVRATLGASWARLLRMVLTESLLLAIIGGVLGSGFAFAATRFLVAIAPSTIPRLDRVTVDWRVLGFAIMVSLFTGLFTGVLTAWQVRKTDYNHALKQGSAGSGSSRSKRYVLGALVAGELALTLMLLIGTALMLQTMARLARVNLGYSTDRVLTMVVTTLDRANSDQFHKEALESVAALPGVKSAAFVWGLPLTGNNWMGSVGIEGRTPSTQAKDLITVPIRSISPDYFSVMGISLKEGRIFNLRDKEGAPTVVIINEEMSRQYFPNENPIDKRLTWRWGPPMKIIGVVSNLRNTGLNAPVVPEVYFSYFQAPAFSKHLAVRTQSDPLSLATAIQRELHRIDPGVVVEGIKTMEQIKDDSISSQRFAMTLLTGFSLMALALSMVGIYGVMSHAVLQRTHEIGVRMAIGAKSIDVLRLILKQGLVLAAIGNIAGLVGSLALTGALRGFLFDIPSNDPLTFVAVPPLLVLVMLIACWVPANRAAKINPLIVLRSQ